MSKILVLDKYIKSSLFNLVNLNKEENNVHLDI